MSKYLSVIAIILLLSSCADPLPEDRQHYVGDWRSKEMGLLILADGTVAYERVDGGVSTSINGPLQEFVGDDFKVGILFITTTFEVSERPHEVDGIWQMTVDGVQLTKINQ